MFERFTDKARKVVILAKAKATERGDDQIRPVHGSKLSLALSFKEARALRHSYIGTEHVLLGLLGVAERYPRGEFATATLPDLGLDPATARDRVLAELSQILRGQRPGR